MHFVRYLDGHTIRHGLVEKIRLALMLSPNCVAACSIPRNQPAPESHLQQ